MRRRKQTLSEQRLLNKRTERRDGESVRSAMNRTDKNRAFSWRHETAAHVVLVHSMVH